MVPANFNQLYYFWIIAKSGSISAAAKRLLLNQSTLSLQMKQLEASFGKRLFSRGRYGVVPTGAGRLAFEYCERIYSHAEELLALLQGDESVAAPAFRLGVSQTVSWRRTVEIMHGIRSAGKFSLKVSTRSSEELQSRLERQMLDMVVSDLDLSVRLSREFRGRLVSSAQLYFVGAPGLKRKMGAFPSGLRRIPLLLRSPNNPVRKETDYFLHKKGVVPDVRAEVESPDIIRTMALQGEGAGLMDPVSGEADIQRGRLVKLHKRPIGIRENVWFICRRQNNDSHPLRKVLDILMEEFVLK